MCGRYAAFISAEELRNQYGTSNATPNSQPTWNMAPTRDAPVVRLHRETRERHLSLLRWGLVPHWVKDPKATRQPIMARAETVASAPMFRDAYAQRRCLVPADAFYEWQIADGGKQPWAIVRADDKPMAFGGLWEGWRGAEGSIIRSFTIVTTTANTQLQAIHERMPVVVEPADWPVWLGEQEGDVDALLRPSPAEFRTWRVGAAVNSVRNDQPSVLEPV